MPTLEIFADVISPWCYIAKRRLEEALRLLAGRGPVEVRWLPFEVHPQTPPAGVERRAFRAARFAGPEEAAAVDAQVADAALAEGLVLALDRIERLPNTRDAHRLIVLAGREGVQDMVVEALFRANFTAARVLTRRETLLAVAAGAGLDRGRAARLLDGDEGHAEVVAAEARARRTGVGRVPHLVLNSWQAVRWHGGAGAIAAALERALPAVPAKGRLGRRGPHRGGSSTASSGPRAAATSAGPAASTRRPTST